MLSLVSVDTNMGTYRVMGALTLVRKPFMEGGVVPPHCAQPKIFHERVICDNHSLWSGCAYTDTFSPTLEDYQLKCFLQFILHGS